MCVYRPLYRQCYCIPLLTSHSTESILCFVLYFLCWGTQTRWTKRDRVRLSAWKCLGIFDVVVILERNPLQIHYINFFSFFYNINSTTNYPMAWIDGNCRICAEHIQHTYGLNTNRINSTYPMVGSHMHFTSCFIVTFSRRHSDFSEKIVRFEENKKVKSHHLKMKKKRSKTTYWFDAPLKS